ncbi:MAG: zf-HC2 domain-containing protein, partial [Acidobacteria bacterium]|nr:zf-HC2 domain-containing protein [Acidobacteriota bacterium]
MSGAGASRDDCAGIRELLAAALANELPAGRVDAVRDHLERCEACRRYRAFEVAFDGALARGLTREEADPALSDRIRDALRREDAREAASSWGRDGAAFRILAAVAATLFVAVVSYGVARRAGAPAAAISPAHPAVEQVRTGVLVCAACERGGS